MIDKAKPLKIRILQSQEEQLKKQKEELANLKGVSKLEEDKTEKRDLEITKSELHYPVFEKKEMLKLVKIISKLAEFVVSKDEIRESYFKDTKNFELMILEQLSKEMKTKSSFLEN